MLLRGNNENGVEVILGLPQTFLVKAQQPIPVLALNDRQKRQEALEEACTFESLQALSASIKTVKAKAARVRSGDGFEYFLLPYFQGHRSYEPLLEEIPQSWAGALKDALDIQEYDYGILVENCKVQSEVVVNGKSYFFQLTVSEVWSQLTKTEGVVYGLS